MRVQQAMVKAGLLALMALASLPAAAQTPPVPLKQLSADEARGDAAMVRAAMEEMHPGLTRYASRAAIDAAWQRLEAATHRPISELELYREISLALAVIRCDHTKAEYSPALDRYRRENPTHLPFRFRLFEDTSGGGLRMFVAASDPAQPIAHGTEVLTLNDQPVASLARQLAEVMAIDGFTEPVRAKKLSDDSDLLGSGWDHYWPAFFGFAGQWKVGLREQPGAAVVTRELKPLSFAAWQTLPWPTRHREDFPTGIQWRISGKTAVLKINTFVNYRSPVDAEALLSAYFRVANRRGVEHLVIDLRDSGGGSTDATQALLAHLIDAPVSWTRRQSVKALKAGPWVRHTERWDGRPGEYSLPESEYVKAADGLWDSKRPPAPVAPAADRFKGRVTVFIGPANNSGATMLISRLKDLERVRLVGEPTGGSAEGPTAGSMLMLRLPASGILVRIPLIFSRMDVKSFEHGLGVKPDVEVRQSLEDFRAGRDSLMEWLRAEARAVPAAGSSAAK